MLAQFCEVEDATAESICALLPKEWCRDLPCGTVPACAHATTPVGFCPSATVTSVLPSCDSDIGLIDYDFH